MRRSSAADRYVPALGFHRLTPFYDAVVRLAGLTDVSETRRFSTMWGTLSLYRAAKPG